MIRAYNVHMGGVDRVDQQLHSIHLLRKSYKWYKKLVLHLISQVILNGHKIFQKHTGYTGDFLSFLHIIITELLLSTPKLNLNKNIHIPDTILRLTGQHFPEQRKADENAKDKRPSKKCRVCYAKGFRSNKGQPLKTVYICKSCPSQPGLHVDGCFEIYHNFLFLFSFFLSVF